MSSYKMIMEFIDESENFSNGFECGIIWNRLCMKKKIFEHPVRLDNSAQIQMLCDSVGAKCEITATKDGWALLTVEYKLI